MVGILAEQFAGYRIPQDEGAVDAPAGNVAPVGAVFYGHHVVGMPFEGEDRLARFNVVHRDVAPQPARHHALAVGAVVYTQQRGRGLDIL